MAVAHSPHHRVLCIDLFHTLVDPEEFRPPTFHRARDAARVLGLRPEAFERFWADQTNERNLARSPSVRERLLAYCEGQGVAPSEHALNVADEIVGRYQDQAILEPHPEVIRTLEALAKHGYRFGLLSNADEREIRAWPRSPLARLFSATTFSCAIGIMKPAPEAYLHLLRQLGNVEPRHALYLGDGANHELEGAREVGFSHVIWQKGFVSRNGLRTPVELEQFRQAATDVVDGFEDLGRVLRELP